MGLSALTKSQKQKLATHLGTQSTQSKWNKYYSRVRISATSAIVTGTLNAYQATPQTVEAFSYGRNQVMASAGLPGVVATLADTNIQQANQTNAGEMVLIEGISIFILGQSDANFTKQIDQAVSVSIEINGTTTYLCGIPSMLPSCGGLFGAAESISVAPPLPDQLSRNIGFVSNGLPHSSNFMKMPEPMLWASAGKGDSTFNVNMALSSTVTTPAQYGSTARIAGAGVAPYTPPLPAAVFTDYLVVLVGCTVNPLSTY